MNKQIRIVVPSVAPGGLEAACSDHFGHCDCFTLVTTEGKDTVGIDVVPNGHGEGCGSLVSQLRETGTDLIMVKGIGRRPLMSFREAGIQVLKGAGATVGEVIESYTTGGAIVVDERSSCQGGSGSHGHGHRHGGLQN
jgi:predicted Fe-Mo cluster-binding NifX family protein